MLESRPTCRLKALQFAGYLTHRTGPTGTQMMQPWVGFMSNFTKVNNDVLSAYKNISL